MNNVYLKGPGDFEPEYTPEPNDEQLQRAIKEHAYAVARNSVDAFPSMVRCALIDYFISGRTDGFDELANASAGDLFHRGEI